ncbi:VOC family protein [Saccharopolyspora flava]|uniref:Glyoxalase-like domain-containing protein n=1 Tax=Saccharopolyspora flava TaxID=95161 RepID=A0A1I6NVQ0_9PSEU|nr:VOC family protein [Saccharopolyspora flava]SFS32011.1 Glyoxalase-like domain-containing protein [Saccharopolyspora flava]
MSSRLAVVVIDAHDTEKVASFWCDVLGWSVVERDEDGIAIGPADGSWPRIDVYRVPESKTVKNRLHFDLRADDRTTAEELERLEALGARRVDVGQPPDVTWVVLADPEGNEFCLLSRSVEDLPNDEKPPNP